MSLIVDGEPLQGLTGGLADDRRAIFVVTDTAVGGEEVEFYLEMACNGLFGAGNNGMM